MQGLVSLDPKGVAGKLKPQLQLIPPVLLVETAKAYSQGAKDYGPWNWRMNKVEYMTYLGAMKRHIDQVIDRVDEGDIDTKSLCHHLGAVAASCGIVLDALNQGMLVDNRPPNNKKREYVCQSTDVLTGNPMYGHVIDGTGVCPRCQEIIP